jgi:hypothetical protein
MSGDTAAPKAAEKPAWRETRYSLRELLADVAEERMTGSFGAERLRQAEINKVFNAETRAHRRPRS